VTSEDQHVYTQYFFIIRLNIKSIDDDLLLL